jgi:hypothetical protein
LSVVEIWPLSVTLELLAIKCTISHAERDTLTLVVDAEVLVLPYKKQVHKPVELYDRCIQCSYS